MKKRIISSMCGVLAVLMIFAVSQTSSFASTTDCLKNENGVWYYMENGERNTTYTGLTNYYGTWYYVENGELNWNYTGLTEYYGTWYYVEKGQLNWSFSGVVDYENDSYYIINGSCDVSFSGLVYSNSKWMFFTSGKQNKAYTGITNYYGTWYYVENGVLNWNYTGLTDYCGTNYYIENGVLNWGRNGISDNNGSLCYVKGGVLDADYNGFAQYGTSWYQFADGKVDSSFSGLKNYSGRWYYLDKGELSWDKTGLIEYYGTYYYVENSILNWNYTGLAKYYGTWYYVENSVLNWNYTGLTSYYGSWYFVEKGVLNWNYTGLTNLDGTWYYVENSVLNWDFSGAVIYSGTVYYVNNGKITWDYNGQGDYNGYTYNFANSVAKEALESHIKKISPSVPSQGEMYKSKYTDYTFAAKGGQTGWYQVNDSLYYLDSDSNAVKGNQLIGGIRYYFNPFGAKASLTGIDVSYHQGNVNWQQLKDSGVDFVIIRVAFRGYGSSGNLKLDERYNEYIQGAESVGMNVGLYVFSQAITVDEAIEEANLALESAKGHNITYPIYFDTEYSSAPNRTGRADGLSVAQRTDCTVAFCEAIKNAGYKTGVYASKDFFYNNLDFNTISAKGYNIWLAHYIGSMTDFKYGYNMWQYSDSCGVTGINGNIDIDISYYDYANNSNMSENGKNIVLVNSTAEYASVISAENAIDKYLSSGLSSDREAAVNAANAVDNKNVGSALLSAIEKIKK